MIKRLYASNFRTLVNFDVEFGPLTLLLGPNGGGKTSVLDVIRLLGEFLRGEKATTLFPSTTLTRWQQVEVQAFEITVADYTGDFVYHVEFEHERLRQECRIQTERLTYNGSPLFESRLQDGRLSANLFDMGSASPISMTDWSRSTIAAVPSLPEYSEIAYFKERMNRTIVTWFNPAAIGARAEDESQTLDWDAANFVAWFRHVTSSDLELAPRLRSYLSEVIGGLESLRLDADGAAAKILRLGFGGGKPPQDKVSYTCRFDELSDGQRALFMLYTLVVSAAENGTICIDEPENFLALREINPWLNMLVDRTNLEPCQAILISHHPELIDALAVGTGRWIDRVGDAHSRAQPIGEEDGGLSVSELVSRGWLHAQ